MVYGMGWAAIYFCLTALYWNAWRQRRALELSPLEITITLTDFWTNSATAGSACCAP